MSDKTVEITIVRPFILNRQDGTSEKFKPGRQLITQADASHWFVQGHSDNPPVVAPQPGTPEHFALLQKARSVETLREELRKAEAAEALANVNKSVKARKIPPAEKHEELEEAAEGTSP